MSNVLAFPAGPPPQTVDQVISIYLTASKHDLGRETYVNRCAVLEEFSRVHGQLGIDAARPYHLKLWIDAQRDRWKSGWTRKGVCSSVQACFNWAVKLGVVDRNPFRGVSYEPGETGQPMEPREFQAMLRASKAIFRRFLIALRFSGARPGEIASAEWSHLNLDRCCIELDRHKTARRTRKPRRIMLHPALLRLLAWIKRHKPHEQFIWVNSRGRPWKKTAIHWRLEQVRAKAGVSPDVSCYGLRHKFCTDGIISGLDISVVAELAGHDRIETTKGYVHLAKQTAHLQSALKQIFAPGSRTTPKG